MSSPIPVFCDWLTMSAPVPHCPPAFEKWLECRTKAQCLDWRRAAWVQLKDGIRPDDSRASDSTKVQIRHNEESGFLHISGNLGRWGQRDNVFGVSVANAGLGFMRFLSKHHGLNVTDTPTIRRVDLTANIGFASAQDYYDWLKWAQSLKLSRLQPRAYQTGVAWVSENWSAKVYDKGADLRRHGLTDLASALETEFGYLGRLEVTLRTDELQRLNASTLADWMEGGTDMQNVIFTEKFKGLLAGTSGASVDELSRSLPLRLANALDAWRNGRNFPAAGSDDSRGHRNQARAGNGQTAEAINVDTGRVELIDAGGVGRGIIGQSEGDAHRIHLELAVTPENVRISFLLADVVRFSGFG